MNARILHLSLLLPVSFTLPALAGPDFVKEIKPLLEVHCIKCHGEEKMEGELDLSSREMAMIGGEYGPALVEGDDAESILMQRIVLPKEHEEVMPTKGRLLTKNEIGKIRAWIKAGAKWPEDLILKEAKKDQPPADQKSPK